MSRRVRARARLVVSLSGHGEKGRVAARVPSSSTSTLQAPASTIGWCPLLIYNRTTVHSLLAYCSPAARASCQEKGLHIEDTLHVAAQPDSLSDRAVSLSLYLCLSLCLSSSLYVTLDVEHHSSPPHATPARRHAPRARTYARIEHPCWHRSHLCCHLCRSHLH